MKENYQYNFKYTQGLITILRINSWWLWKHNSNNFPLKLVCNQTPRVVYSQDLYLYESISLAREKQRTMWTGYIYAIHQPWQVILNRCQRRDALQWKTIDNGNSELRLSRANVCILRLLSSWNTIYIHTVYRRLYDQLFIRLVSFLLHLRC